MSLMGRAVRPGARRGEHPAVARALGPHPGLPLLRAALPAGEQVPHLRRREELGDARGHPRGADGAALLPGADAEEHGRRDRHRRHRRGDAVPGRPVARCGPRRTRTAARARSPSGSRRAGARSSTPATPATARKVRPRRRSRSTAAPTCSSTTAPTRPRTAAATPTAGFSSVEDAVAAAIAGEVKRLVLFHYDQDYSDAEVDALLRPRAPPARRARRQGDRALRRHGRRDDHNLGAHFTTW